MKYIIISFICLTFSIPNCLGKVKSGAYTLTGFALSKSGDTLRNETIIVYFKDEADTIQTDQNGKYKTKIHWSTACPSGVNLWQRKRATKKLNPKYIYFTHNGSKTRIVNEWKDFVSIDSICLPKNTNKKNLIFA